MLGKKANGLNGKPFNPEGSGERLQGHHGPLVIISSFPLSENDSILRHCSSKGCGLISHFIQNTCNYPSVNHNTLLITIIP